MVWWSLAWLAWGGVCYGAGWWAGDDAGARRGYILGAMGLGPYVIASRRAAARRVAEGRRPPV